MDKVEVSIFDYLNLITFIPISSGKLTNEYGRIRPYSLEQVPRVKLNCGHDLAVAIVPVVRAVGRFIFVRVT